MDNETLLKEILHAFKLYTDKINKMFDEFEENLDKHFDRIMKKIDGK